jgi:hypothetical protein
VSYAADAVLLLLLVLLVLLMVPMRSSVRQFGQSA